MRREVSAALEYDTMSGLYAEFVEKRYNAACRHNFNANLMRFTNGTRHHGRHPGGSCALSMAWYHPELYHRVLTILWHVTLTSSGHLTPPDAALRAGVPRTPHPEQSRSRCASGWRWLSG